MAGNKNRSRSNSSSRSGTKTPPPKYNPGGKKNQTWNQNNNDDTSTQDVPRPAGVTCTFCSRNGHKAEDCWKNPNSTKNAKASDTKTTTPEEPKEQQAGRHHKQEQQKTRRRSQTPVATSGWTFASCIPITTETQTPYCGPCNSRAHHTSRCGDQRASHRFSHSLIVCWKCAYRGHTGDECQNPQPTEFVKRCGVCRDIKHTTDACTHQTQRRLCEALAYGRAAPRTVFAYTANDTEMSGTDQQQLQLAVPTFSQTSRTPTPRTSTISTNSPTRLAELRRKVNDGATLYTKSLYNMVLARNSSEIQALGLLSQYTWWEVSKRLAQGFNFFRDPQAMGAMVLDRKPYCYQCAKEGVILDKNMCGVAGRDPLTIEDGARWGVFVMFECKCSKDGYDYV